MPVRPKTAAMMAMIRNVIAQDSILLSSFESPVAEHARMEYRADYNVVQQATCRDQARSDAARMEAREGARYLPAAGKSMRWMNTTLPLSFFTTL
jgi:hypothetical protein